ncbi:MAG: endo alpha-1,4 polygalactosaminidase [Pseudomonadota bacterium]
MHSFKLLLAAVAVWLLPSQAQASGGEIAFYYGANPPASVLSQFQRIVVEPDNVTPEQHRALRQHGGQTYGYISIGEIGPTREWYDKLPDSATFGVNASWNSKVMDLSSTDWQRFVLQRVSELVNRGYNGLFMDTLDSYQLYAETQAQRQQQEQGLSNLLYRIKRQYPNLNLIANRGFEVMDQIAPYLEGVAAESLFTGWNNNTGKYVEVPENDRQWLLTKLQQIQQQHDLDIIAIDYLPPAERSRAREVAADIIELGFIPWVANPELDYVGIGSLEAIPREVLMLFDSNITQTMELSEAHTLLATPLEYMGYVPMYHDLAKKPLPTGVLTGRYAGVIIWNREPVKDASYPDWLKHTLNSNLPVAFFGSLGTTADAQLNELLGITPAAGVHYDSLTLKSTDEMSEFEMDIPPRMTPLPLYARSTAAGNTSHMRFVDKNGTETDTVVTGPWGGYALAPTVIDIGIDEQSQWIINPFMFLRRALKLPNIPMPDVTTENGNRLWLAHIDGDALPSWAELPGRRLGAEVLYDEILSTYDLPHTVSIVEAEIVLNLYLDRRARMADVIRKTFELDNVELATHTYSHPFRWNLISQGERSGEYNLPVPEYRLDYQREIVGSINFINRNLAPPHKSTNIVLWSGDAIPPEEALEVVYRNGLLNMNGGNTRISKSLPTVAAISPNARTVGDYVQVYAPIINENVYTNDWTGPYDGYREVIDTFVMTDVPRRIKPINVYYHNYIGTKAASLRSLKEVYQWSVEQPIFPVYSSDYIRKVPDFRTAGVGRYLDGRWKVSGLGNIRSLRVLKHSSWPDLRSTNTIIGAKQLHDGIYMHTNGADTVSFYTTRSEPRNLRLVSTNARVDYWQTSAVGPVSFRLTGHLPVTLELNGDKRFCDLRQREKTITGELTPQGNTRYQFTTKDTGNAVIDCQT